MGQHIVRGSEHSDPAYAGLELLYRAYLYAIDTHSEVWEFALDAVTLGQSGLTKNEFRWLIARGFALHAEEITLSSNDCRRFKSLPKHLFPPTTCFVITQEGVDFFEELVPTFEFLSCCQDGAQVVQNSRLDTDAGFQPTWSRENRELVVGTVLLKRYRWPAPNQEIVLDVFEEEGWPHQIDDPLPRRKGQDVCRRLHDTIKGLNQGHSRRILRFHGDGTGERVVWDPVDQPAR